MQESQYAFSQPTQNSNVLSQIPHTWPSPFYEESIDEIKLSRQLTFLDLKRNRMKGGNTIGEYVKGQPITPIELINLTENDQGFKNPIVVMKESNITESEDFRNLSYYSSSKSEDVFLSCNPNTCQSFDPRQYIKQSLYKQNKKRWEEIGFKPRNQ